MLLAGIQGIAANDELAVRGPMLVAQHEGCVAMGRRIAGRSSVLSLHLASSIEDLARGATLDSGAASADQVRAFMAAMQQAAAVATTQSRAAE